MVAFPDHFVGGLIDRRESVFNKILFCLSNATIDCARVFHLQSSFGDVKPDPFGDTVNELEHS